MGICIIDLRFGTDFIRLQAAQQPSAPTALLNEILLFQCFARLPRLSGTLRTTVSSHSLYDLLKVALTAAPGCADGVLSKPPL